MKLVTYDTRDKPRAGVVVDGQVLDVATVIGEHGGLRDVRALLELPDDPLTRLKLALESARAGRGVPLDRVRLRAPILQPPAVFLPGSGFRFWTISKHESKGSVLVREFTRLDEFLDF